MITKPFSTVNVGGTGNAFTLIELLISLAVTAMIILGVAQLMNSATAVTRTGSKHIDTDTQGRAILDRMALDFGKMLKRPDVDYFIKQPGAAYPPGNSAGHSQGAGKKASSGQKCNDQIAFFSQVPGYYPAGAQSPVSLVAYRINANSNSSNPSYLQLERMGKGFVWNGVSNVNIPVVFLPLTITATWPPAVNNASSNSASSQDPSYEIIGPQVFRFEYYYLLKNGKLKDTPWDTDAGHTSINGFADIEAISVAIAVIDPASRSLISPDSLFDLASDMADFKSAPGKGLGGAKKTGDLENQWKGVIQSVVATGQTSRGSPVPAAAASAIRIYNRYFDMRTF